MAETYPQTLPLPDHITYASAQTFGVVRTSLPGPTENQRKYFNSNRETISADFAMDDATWTTWRDWMRTNGYDWFYLQVVSSSAPVDITSAQLVRLVSPINRVIAGYNWNRATLELEMVPGQADDPLAPAPAWDIIDGGNFAIPAMGPDSGPIEGGTPASPSPGLIWAQLYDY